MSDPVIWKFRLTPGALTHEMPRGAKIIHVAGQHMGVSVWAECDPDAEKVERRITAVPTGGPPGPGEHIGSAVFDSGFMVFHVYDAGGPGR